MDTQSKTDTDAAYRAVLDVPARRMAEAYPSAYLAVLGWFLYPRRSLAWWLVAAPLWIFTVQIRFLHTLTGGLPRTRWHAIIVTIPLGLALVALGLAMHYIWGYGLFEWWRPNR